MAWALAAPSVEPSAPFSRRLSGWEPLSRSPASGWLSPDQLRRRWPAQVQAPRPADWLACSSVQEFLIQEKQFAKASDRIVIVAGSAMGTPNTLSGIVLHTLGDLASPSFPVEAGIAELP